jgi:hypothetical protein
MIIVLIFYLEKKSLLLLEYRGRLGFLLTPTPWG